MPSIMPLKDIRSAWKVDSYIKTNKEGGYIYEKKSRETPAVKLPGLKSSNTIQYY